MHRNKARMRHRGVFAVCLGVAGCWGEVGQKETDPAESDPSSEASASVPTTGDSGDPQDPSNADPTESSDPTGETEADPDCVEKRSAARSLLVERCAGCHTGPNASVFDYVDDLDELVAQGKVKGGDPGGSPLYQVIQSDVMPKTTEKLSADEKLVIQGWISECTNPEPTLPPKQCANNKFISTEEMLIAMHDGVTDIKAVDPDDQKFVRYFTLTHLWNAGMCDEEIEVYRHGLAKLLNSLSNQPKIVIPAPVDPEHTIYRIDLRDYGWDAALWELLVDRDPFAVQYLQDTAKSLQSLTGTLVPFQFADWFVTDASQAPLYDQVLYERVFKIKADIFSAVDPLSQFDLEEFLGVPVDANITLEKAEDPGIVARAGVQLSGVSNQNRVIERHAFLDNFSRSYWLSYDFLENVGDSNIFYNPLDFVAAGGEIIWTLPNGLQGYMLVDAVGDRIDEGPIDVVSNKEENGTPIINGVSCMGCHYQGMRSIVDEVAPFAVDQVGLFGAEELERIANLYPPAAEFAEGLTLDSDVFVASVAKTGAPLLVGSDEVTETVYYAFEEAAVNLRRGASELGITADSLLPKIGQLPPGLQMINGGFVNRDSMRSEYAQAICNLKLGITKKCLPG